MPKTAIQSLHALADIILNSFLEPFPEKLQSQVLLPLPSYGIRTVPAHTFPCLRRRLPARRF